jgi:hypothetical protein
MKTSLHVALAVRSQKRTVPGWTAAPVETTVAVRVTVEPTATDVESIPPLVTERVVEVVLAARDTTLAQSKATSIEPVVARLNADFRP